MHRRPRVRVLSRPFLLIMTGLAFGSASSGAQSSPGTAARPWTPSAQDGQSQDHARYGAETEIDSKHVYTLPELIDLAEQHNPATRQAWQLAKVRAAQVTVARSDLLPALSAVAIAETTRQGVLFGSEFVRQTVGDYEPVLQVRYLAFDFGERASRIAAARDELLAANFSFNTVHQTVLFDTERRYYALLNAVGQRAAAEVNLRNAETVAKAVEARLAVGLATLPDALEARAAAAQADYEVQAAIGQVDIARGELLDVLGASPLKALEVQPLDELQLPKSLSEDAGAAVARSLEQRPELGEQLAAKRAAEAEIKGARSAFLPTLNFTGTGGEVRAYGQQNQLSSTYAGPVEIWDARLELRWDVFDGGRRMGELERAHADERRAQAQMDRTRDEVESQVWTAFVSLRTAFHQRDAAAALLVAARSSYEASVKAYQYGVRSTVDVVSAQRSLAEALRADVAARAGLLTQLANFSYRTGDLLRAASKRTPPGGKP